MKVTEYLGNRLELPENCTIDMHLRVYKDNALGRFIVWIKQLFSDNLFDPLQVARAIDQTFPVEKEWIEDSRIHAFMLALKEKVTASASSNQEVTQIFTRVMASFPKPLTDAEKNADWVEVKLDELLNTAEREKYASSLAALKHPYETQKRPLTIEQKDFFGKTLEFFISRRRLADLEELAGKGFSYCWNRVLNRVFTTGAFYRSPKKIREGQSVFPKERFGRVLGSFLADSRRAEEGIHRRDAQALKARYPMLSEKFLLETLQEHRGNALPSSAELIERALGEKLPEEGAPYNKIRNYAIDSMQRVAKVFEKEQASAAIAHALDQAKIKGSGDIANLLSDPDAYIQDANRENYKTDKGLLLGAFDLLLKKSSDVSPLNQKAIREFVAELHKQIPLHVTPSKLRWSS